MTSPEDVIRRRVERDARERQAAAARAQQQVAEADDVRRQARRAFAECLPRLAEHEYPDAELIDVGHLKGRILSSSAKWVAVHKAAWRMYVNRVWSVHGYADQPVYLGLDGRVYWQPSPNAVTREWASCPLEDGPRKAHEFVLTTLPHLVELHELLAATAAVARELAARTPGGAAAVDAVLDAFLERCKGDDPATWRSSASTISRHALLLAAARQWLADGVEPEALRGDTAARVPDATHRPAPSPT